MAPLSFNPWLSLSHSDYHCHIATTEGGHYGGLCWPIWLGWRLGHRTSVFIWGSRWLFMSMACPDFGGKWLVDYSPIHDPGTGVSTMAWNGDPRPHIPLALMPGIPGCGLDRPVYIPPFFNSLDLALDFYQHCDWWGKPWAICFAYMFSAHPYEAAVMSLPHVVKIDWDSKSVCQRSHKCLTFLLLW